MADRSLTVVSVIGALPEFYRLDVVGTFDRRIGPVKQQRDRGVSLVSC
jgi:hypothetical protein